MGIFEDADLRKVLALLAPQAFSDQVEPPEEQVENNSTGQKEWILEDDKSNSYNVGLLEMKLPEAVKLEVNEEKPVWNFALNALFKLCSKVRRK